MLMTLGQYCTINHVQWPHVKWKHICVIALDTTTAIFKSNFTHHAPQSMCTSKLIMYTIINVVVHIQSRQSTTCYSEIY